MSAGKSADAPARVMVVEDEPDLGALLEYVLGQEGLKVEVARNGGEALEALARGEPDLVLLDLMLPDMDGLEILRKLKSERRNGSRVIVLSARKDEQDRVRGFELGADDYLVKPFSPRELILRIRTTLRSRAPAAGGGKAVLLSAGPIVIDLERHEVRVEGRLVHLTLTEFNLLADMMRHQGRVRSRETLMSEVWGYDSEAMTRTIDTHVRRVRTKLGPAAAWLGTVRGVGYRFRAPDAAP
jgi:two-component system phosphate regulon response regulator PhoB